MAQHGITYGLYSTSHTGMDRQIRVNRTDGTDDNVSLSQRNKVGEGAFSLFGLYRIITGGKDSDSSGSTSDRKRGDRRLEENVRRIKELENERKVVINDYWKLKEQITKIVQAKYTSEGGTINYLPFGLDKPIELSPGWLATLIVHRQSYDIFHCDVNKGGELQPHQHQQLESIMVISGKLEVHLDHKIVELKSGDVTIVPNNIVHGVIALEDATCVVIFQPSIT